VTVQGDGYSCGLNNEGQLGVGNYHNYDLPQPIFKEPGQPNHKFKKIECGSYSGAISAHDDFYVWGFFNGELYSRPQKITEFSKKIKQIRIK